ncbi:hypothetical protein KAFR_0C05580 [Kazachstania africana CBS 2517]|uniref:Large ribosomal subunit protein uL4m n=1 Tax=Kazachstania africana (strain ATCC 22294 / BCRC 22015 / CBS 2517 / CECT 1963 / NBRC 1671 / NRRL Y-8276) TaxID=1071382 RepID=H2AT49_KAZAF|nr:hypothetical protein KAFR_0C05580 [Kazachstania africana CBS 2517]CCF57549.1 hypothetical protein KAFR_0C05580 [Kazachstania africana CBS 2517]
MNVKTQGLQVTLKWLKFSRFYASTTKPSPLPNLQLPPKYTLASLRAFPSLEPLTYIPVSTEVLGLPLRRDVLWQAIVFENDNKRVGSSNPPGRSTNGYSRHKLRPQKGSGKARLGDANSPMLHKGGRALARTAPHDYTTKLPRKLYSLAFNTALSYQYEKGNLYVIGDASNVDPINLNDVNKLDIPVFPETTAKYRSSLFKKFLQEHKLNGKRLLFITTENRNDLLRYSDYYKQKVDVIQKEGVEVNDLLKASKIFIELEAFQYLAEQHAQ